MEQITIPPETAVVAGRSPTKEFSIPQNQETRGYAGSCKSMETTLRSTGRQTLGQNPAERILYLCCTIPWTTCLAFLYMLIAALPLLILTIFDSKGPSQILLRPARKLYGIHESNMMVGLPENPLRILALQLSGPIVALLAAFAGALAALSQIYSFVLGEHDGTATILDWTLCSWLAWLLIFCSDLDELKTQKAEDFV